MHLLVLSAFRPFHYGQREALAMCLNAPFGAQCFPTCVRQLRQPPTSVSMHLLVLSAFRHVR